MVLFSFFAGLLISLLTYIGLTRWVPYRRDWRIASRNEPAGATLGETTGRNSSSLPVSAHPFSVRPKCFSGDSRTFKEWCFTVDLALQSSHIRNGPNQVNLVSSLLEGNALLWYITCLESGSSFDSWFDLRNALAKTFGPIQREEEDRFEFFSIRQKASLQDYIQDFSRLSLSVTGLDEHSRAVLFVKGLKPALQAETLREHPRTLSDALAAARLANRQLEIFQPLPKARDVAYKAPPSRRPNSASTEHSSGKQRPKLDDDLRRTLMQEGRCFRCHRVGHLARNCPERIHPNEDRQ